MHAGRSDSCGVHAGRNVIRYCRQREVFGKTLARYQNTQFALAEMASGGENRRTFIDKLIIEHWQERQ